MLEAIDNALAKRYLSPKEKLQTEIVRRLLSKSFTRDTSIKNLYRFEMGDGKILSVSIELKNWIEGVYLAFSFQDENGNVLYHETVTDSVIGSFRHHPFGELYEHVTDQHRKEINEDKVTDLTELLQRIN